ncbi:MFS transporter [Roseomonas marmotae]|uniref:MFS transporter n=1 Tax=Roseomonas marmotae TaxID=2768161 RepID=A0ABS3KEL0_9PROT|nr:MFS transporter [Roseomonas marmotae]MBO1075913.1 MFS transporter [Roseomonas marmotae]QTI81904.1 MFS transporter [Roseomonas marmotae]
MASRRSERALDWLNFFVADVQTGFGPFVAVYLTAQAWTEVQIGFVLSIGTATAMLAQVPAGMLVDATPRKRLAALVALASIAVSALLLAAWPEWLPVIASEVLHGVASCVLAPAVAAISLALVGRARLGERLGRNARYASIGNGVAAAAMGSVGAWLSGASVFWLTAALTVPSLIALMMIRAEDLHPPPVIRDPKTAAPRDSIWLLLRNRGVLVFALCCLLFTLSNAAMLPLVGAEITRLGGEQANLVIAACIVVPQLVVAALSPWVGRLAESRGRRIVLLLGFSALPLRGALLAVVSDPIGLAAVQALDGISAAVMGVLLPLLAADLTRGTNRFNLCMGLFGLAVGIGGTISTSLAGAVSTWFGPAAAFGMLAGCGLLAIPLLLFAMPETREKENGAA